MDNADRKATAEVPTEVGGLLEQQQPAKDPLDTALDMRGARFPCKACTQRFSTHPEG